jgi:hypothetical protein
MVVMRQRAFGKKRISDDLIHFQSTDKNAVKAYCKSHNVKLASQRRIAKTITRKLRDKRDNVAPAFVDFFNQVWFEHDKLLKRLEQGFLVEFPSWEEPPLIVRVANPSLSQSNTSEGRITLPSASLS